MLHSSAHLHEVLENIPLEARVGLNINQAHRDQKIPAILKFRLRNHFSFSQSKGLHRVTNRCTSILDLLGFKSKSFPFLSRYSERSKTYFFYSAAITLVNGLSVMYKTPIYLQSRNNVSSILHQLIQIGHLSSFLEFFK